MSNLWRTFFGYSDDNPNETYSEAVERAKRLLGEGNYEDACRILKYSEKQQHAEAMYLLAWCYWHGHGVREDAGRAISLWRQSAALGYAPAIERSEALKAAHERVERQEGEAL
jgi:TPR repeat protein